MKKLLILLTVLFIYSCSSNEQSVTEENNYYALKVGNSWVYKNYQYNRNSQSYLPTDVIDSVSIVSKETINGFEYYNFRRKTTGNDTNLFYCNQNGEHFEFLRDSLGYLVTPENKVRFANNDFSERNLNGNNFTTIYEKLQNSKEEITVNSGSFMCDFAKRYAKDQNGVLLPGEDKTYYSEGIGLIQNSNSSVNNNIPVILIKLDSYNLN